MGVTRFEAKLRPPLVQPQRLKIRDVDILVIPGRCKGCDLCIELCPKDVLIHDTKLNVRGVYPPVVKDAEACVGCGVCEEICPDFAIFMQSKSG